MAIPTGKELRVPALRLLETGESLRASDFDKHLSLEFRLTPEEISRKYESGNGQIFGDRVRWALSAISRTGLAERRERGVYRISDLGREMLNQPEKINAFIAEKIKEQRSAANKGKQKSKPADDDEEGTTPLGKISEASSEMRESLYDEILSTILGKSPWEFEKLVVSLLQKMGYGGEVEDAGTVTPLTGDRGIDGVIKEDVLGLGRIHIQAKRYGEDNIVQAKQIREFIGALSGPKASKGVFITTSSYTKGAREAAVNTSPPIVLIDGRQLAEYIYDYGLGMQIEETIEIKKLDAEFWDSMQDDESTLDS